MSKGVMTRDEWEEWRRRMGKPSPPLTARPATPRRTCAERIAELQARINELENEVYRLRGGQRVYFMEFDTTIKIGTSIDPLARAKHLGGRLLGHIPGGTELEASLHREWAHIRVTVDSEGGSEHFAKSPSLVAFVEQQLSTSASAVKIPRSQNAGSGRA